MKECFICEKIKETGKYQYAIDSIVLEMDKLQAIIDKAIEYIGNGNLGIPRKTRDKFIKILKGEDNDTN